MADIEFPEDEPDVLPPEEPYPNLPPGPNESDPDRAILSSIIPGTAGPTLREEATKLLGIKNSMGKFVAERMLKRPDPEGSEILRHRSRIAFIDGAALQVPRLFDELGAKQPNKKRIDGILAVLKSAGIAVDSVPITAKQREADIAESQSAANASPIELRRRIDARLAKMRLEATTASDKANEK